MGTNIKGTNLKSLNQTSPAPPWCSSHVRDHESNLVPLVVASHLSSVDDCN